MPSTLIDEELESTKLLGDDSSDEAESGDDESGTASSNESGSGSDDESADDSDGDDDDSDDDDDEDSDDEDDSGSDSGSGSDSDSDSNSDSDASSSKKKTKKKNKKAKAEEEKKEDENNSVPAVFKIQQISSRLSWLLDDLHRTFKPKSVPKLDPQQVFPYPYTPLSQQSPNSSLKAVPSTSTNPKSPISSPVRHGNAVDRGSGGNFIYPSYAAPPSKNEIKSLYANYSDKERVKIDRNQQREKQRKSLFTDRSKQNDENVWENGGFSKQFIAASREQRQKNVLQDTKNVATSSANKDDGDEEEEEEEDAAHTFDALYKHYDAQKRLIEQKQNKMQRMKNKLYWFRKNNEKQQQNASLSEQRSLIHARKPTISSSSSNAKELKETENTLLNKAAQLLLGNNKNPKQNNAITSSNKVEIVTVADSPDSLQEKILNIAEEEEHDGDVPGNRLPTFV
eukprot:CAMPEP_0202695726 /NCGR_PEP_ID=MMETSP1385-20130828/9250_1 /ASSEMBLY_ACC=CAM_ASM_000861 /TAXON_ID=933848 /ORGANISM="Elphidium margaritaceum" /LENGTH=453 /DNA_ID=CAMNT_0049351803 /DNA_START=59 /DNA_END=1420 /DNA_ORIENTATION=-